MIGLKRAKSASDGVIAKPFPLLQLVPTILICTRYLTCIHLPSAVAVTYAKDAISETENELQRKKQFPRRGKFAPSFACYLRREGSLIRI